MRAAPLGPVGAEVVTATFYNFAPEFVARRVPGVWQVTDPATVLGARLAGVDAAVRRVLGEEWPASAAAAELAELLPAATAVVDVPGRPLAAANAGLPVPAEPHLGVWQALTTLREHRGDGHDAALLQRGISGPGAHVLAAAAGRDRKSTRLNSSHANISYAVFCLKKKKLKKAVSSTPIRCLTYVCTA